MAGLEVLRLWYDLVWLGGRCAVEFFMLGEI